MKHITLILIIFVLQGCKPTSAPVMCNINTGDIVTFKALPNTQYLVTRTNRWDPPNRCYHSLVDENSMELESIVSKLLIKIDRE